MSRHCAWCSGAAQARAKAKGKTAWWDWLLLPRHWKHAERRGRK